MKSLKTGVNRCPATLFLWLRAWVVCIALLTGCGKRDTVEPAVGIDSPEDTWVRVLLFGNLRECSVETPAGFTAEGVGNGIAADFSDTDRMPIGIQNGRIRVGEHLLDKTVILRPKYPFFFRLDGRGFRGNVTFQVNEDANSFSAVNSVPLESYLLGVVGAEMHSYWEPEALKAQAVTARTYCLAIKHRFGSGRAWDLTRTQANQVYDGLAAENTRVRQAVLATTGQILIGKRSDGGESFFPAYYSSSCGGHTEDSRAIFGEDAVSLPGVECPWCKSIARRKDFYWGPVFYTMETVSAKLIERYPSLTRLERITDIEVMQNGHYGRFTQIRLIGANGSKDSLRGEDFRLSLDSTGRRLKSTLAIITKTNGGLLFEEGRGFGHGVGLCQCGAQGMAREGLDYTEILSFYYPGTRIVTIETPAAP
jgi:stage II sporulation protein D